MTNLKAENVQTVIDTIRAAPEEDFDMSHWTCGTSACIGGWVQRIFHPEKGDRRELLDDDVAADHLGLSLQDATALFYADRGDDYSNIDYDMITRDHAIIALEEVRDTGEFTNWTHIVRPEEA